MPETNHSDPVEQLRRQRDQARAVATWLLRFCPAVLRADTEQMLPWLRDHRVARPPWSTPLVEYLGGGTPRTAELPVVEPPG